MLREPLLPPTGPGLPPTPGAPPEPLTNMPPPAAELPEDWCMFAPGACPFPPQAELTTTKADASADLKATEQRISPHRTPKDVPESLGLDRGRLTWDAAWS